VHGVWLLNNYTTYAGTLLNHSPVYVLLPAISSGVPVATIYPPLSPFRTKIDDIICREF